MKQSSRIELSIADEESTALSARATTPSTTSRSSSPGWSRSAANWDCSMLLRKMQAGFMSTSPVGRLRCRPSMDTTVIISSSSRRISNHISNLLAYASHRNSNTQDSTNSNSNSRTKSSKSSKKSCRVSCGNSANAVWLCKSYLHDVYDLV